MPFDTNNAELNTASEVWILPPALVQLAECGDADLVQELIEIFQTDTVSRLKVLDAAVAERNYAVVRAEAHTIKGSALQIGAARLAASCQQLELDAQKVPPVEMKETAGRIRQRFHEICDAIAAAQASPAKPFFS